MLGQRRQEHRLIAEAPITLHALIRHDIAAGEEAWFARCRADFLRSFPTLLLEWTRLLILLGLLGASAGRAYALCAMLGCLFASAAHILAQRIEQRDDSNERRNLVRRGWLMGLRTQWWSMAVFWGCLFAPLSTREALIALAITMMMIDGIAATTLPRLALGLSMLQGVALTLGCLLAQGLAAAWVGVIALVAGTFLHWTLFNFYYMFATRRLRTRRLSQSHETVRLLLNQYDDEGSDWLYELDAGGAIRHPSARFCAALGLEPGVLDGLELEALFNGEAAEALAGHLRAGQPFRAQVLSLVIGDEERWWSISGRPITNAAGACQGWRGFVADITEARRAEARVTWLAHYDALTGLANRALLQANLERVLAGRRERERVSLLYIDLDLFKEINDGLGHSAGDAVLIETARRLEHAVRPRDLVARLGGDEFVVLADGADAGAAQMIAQRILTAVAQPIDLDGQIAHVGASIGIATAPGDALSAGDLLRAADVAMYHAKAAGRRGFAVFDPEMQTRVRERRELELDLRAAIRLGQLELHYQPLLDLSDGRTVGHEALLRWQHPARGLISPDDFIPIAEETGLIVDIGQWVIREALSEAARWPEHMTIAVNLSPAQLRDKALLPTIVQALAHSGVASQRLELEITETMLLQDTQDVLALLHQLRALGVRIALDDFGTGYSSLNYLRSFPFDKIKIDRCFIAELTAREDCQAIVRSVLSMASDLNMVTTAEGVEALEQLEALRAGGCDQAQGYLFSKALPAAELGLPPHQPIAWDETPLLLGQAMRG
ncbi:putative bifunctional diguanylate cyclase/phosphodiesterase [Novosphingobium rosa]|uniref:putative bifunctional diguanylate cyclase/phosphodiesterase n=1 Tax=Novosphingobium rosa TaxID=76978 RepID=UPI00082DA7B4|nr:GGDEF and EAL domain-containing protein [Novosphingobium rosa]